MFPDFGHAPQIQDPQAFHETLLKNLDALRRHQLVTPND